MKLGSGESERRFYARVAELGGEVLEPHWLGTRFPHRVRCAEGHLVTPSAASVIAGRGICRVCAGKDPGAAERAFRKRLDELGAVLVEPRWLGCMVKHRVICSDGHDCTPKPNDTQQGRGICRACAGNDPQESERKFRQRVAELGGQVVEPAYLGGKAPHRVICAEGHACRPRPSDVIKGHGFCLTCADKDPAVAERRFRECVAEQGGQVLEWNGSQKPARVICADGHEASPRPTGVISRRSGICRACAGRDPETAWRNFRARVAELGGTVIEPAWLGNTRPHRVICRNGHACAPWPASVQQGQGLCRYCWGIDWDVFYVVTNDDLQAVKFGITSGDPRGRLAEHRRAGYRTPVRIRTGMTNAYALERAVLATLRISGAKPVRGLEYFDISALPVILDVADGWVESPSADPDVDPPLGQLALFTPGSLAADKVLAKIK